MFGWCTLCQTAHFQLGRSFLRCAFYLHDFSRGRLAKDGLHQFKNIASQTAVSSIENVVRYYLDTTNKKVTEAQGALDGACVMLLFRVNLSFN
jgi:hypothetical protein